MSRTDTIIVSINGLSKGEVKRTRLQPIRTASEITANIIIQPPQQTPLYQKLAQKITGLRLLGISHEKIAKSLNVSRRTILRAWKFHKSRINGSGRQK